MYKFIFPLNSCFTFSVTKRINDHNKRALAKPQADRDNAVDQVKKITKYNRYG